jgi:BirA family transcriptional regulator, biotin operon repressor / biotin---[acetyl-CoA-carboxylase] ligase
MSWDSKLFERHLTTRRFGREFVWLEEIDSTNRWMIENYARFTMSGGVVAADHQNAGRGRYQRIWHDAPGTALLFSIMLQHRVEGENAGLVNLLPAVVLADVLSGSLGLGWRVRVKWPNDILLNDRKIAGILGQRAGAREDAVSVFGVGLNVSTDSADFPQELRGSATSILAETNDAPRREILLASVLRRWEELFDDYAEGQFDVIRAGWERHGPVHGASLIRREGESVFAGRFAGLGAGGQLRLADEAGVIHEFSSGDTDL